MTGFDRDDHFTDPCGVLRPLQVFYYSAGASRDRFYAVFTTSFSGSSRYRRWRREEELEPLLAWRRTSLHETLLRMPFDAGLERALDLVEEEGCFRDRPSLRGILEAALRSGGEGAEPTAPLSAEAERGWIDRFRNERGTGPPASGADPGPLQLRLAQVPAGEVTLLDVELVAPVAVARSWPQARAGYASVAASLEVLEADGASEPMEALARRYFVHLEQLTRDEEVALPVAAALPAGRYLLVLRLFAAGNRTLRRVVPLTIPPPTGSVREREGRAESPAPREASADTGVPPRLESEPGRQRIALIAEAHRFGVRLRELGPRDPSAGEALVLADIDLPLGGELDRLDFLLGDRELGSLHAGPWLWHFRLPSARPAVLRARAMLRDGRIAEDAILSGGAGLGERVDVRLVELYVTAQDRRGRPISELGVPDVVVLEDGAPQRVIGVEEVGSIPISIAVMADASSTMIEKVDLERRAALQFFRNVLRAQDRGAFLLFNHRLELVVPFTGDLAWLEDGTAALRAGGGTSLWDSLLYTLRYVAGWSGRRAIVVLTDGHDESSHSTYEQAHELARRAGVPIFPIHLDLHRRLPYPMRDPGLRWRAAASRRLGALARASGGARYEAATASGIDAAFAEIERALRTQHRIVYASPAIEDQSGGSRAVEIRVVRPGVVLRAGSGRVED